MTPDFKGVLSLDTDGAIATVTLTRPKAFNAINDDLRAALRTVVAHIDTLDDIRVVILRGEGPGFCAGADLKDGLGTTPTDHMLEAEYRPSLVGIANSPKIFAESTLPSGNSTLASSSASSSVNAASSASSLMYRS